MVYFEMTLQNVFQINIKILKENLEIRGGILEMTIQTMVQIAIKMQKTNVKLSGRTFKIDTSEFGTNIIY